MGFFDWFFKGEEIKPERQPMLVQGGPNGGPLAAWTDWLFSGLSQKPGGGYDMSGVASYPGQLSPDLTNTMLPLLFSSWSPQGGPGQQYLDSFLAGGGAKMPAQVQSGLDVLMQNGGLGGAPTAALYNMMQFGGVGGPGNQAMSNLLQFGVPGEVGRPVGNMAQFGVGGQGQMPLYNRAMGRPTAASDYLAAYTNRGGKK